MATKWTVPPSWSGFVTWDRSTNVGRQDERDYPLVMKPGLVILSNRSSITLEPEQDN